MPTYIDTVLKEFDNAMFEVGVPFTPEQHKTTMRVHEELRKQFREYLKSSLEHFAQMVEKEVIELKSEWPQRIWSKSLEDVELGIALDGLETFKSEQRTKLKALLETKQEN